MDSVKYIGMDVHKKAIAVVNSSGKPVMECTIEMKAGSILQFIQGLRGNLQVTFEEGTWAAWLHDLLKSHVTKIVRLPKLRSQPLVLGGDRRFRIRPLSVGSNAALAWR
jgi:hypothetical protein